MERPQQILEAEGLPEERCMRQLRNFGERIFEQKLNLNLERYEKSNTTEAKFYFKEEEDGTLSKVELHKVKTVYKPHAEVHETVRNIVNAL